MILGSVIQQPDEHLDYDFDYSEFITGSGTLQEAPLIVESVPAGLTLTASLIGDTRVKVWVSGGVADTQYTVEVTVVTSNGRQKQDELIVNIVEY